jgi:hypothetical protein
MTIIPRHVHREGERKRDSTSGKVTTLPAASAKSVSAADLSDAEKKNPRRTSLPLRTLIRENVDNE